MQPQTFTVGEALRFGWEKTKKHFWFWVVILLCMIAIQIIFSFLGSDDPDWGVYSFLVSILGWAVAIAVEIGSIRLVIKMLDDKRGDIKDFLPDWDLFWRFLLGWILYSAVVVVGLILLIVPGVIWAIKYHFTPYLIVDKGMRPMDAFRESGRMTQGSKGNLLWFFIASGLLVILGFLALVIGSFWAVPTVMIATAWVYRRLSQPAAASASDAAVAPAISV